jgi:predicted transcriptional regulator
MRQFPIVRASWDQSRASPLGQLGMTADVIAEQLGIGRRTVFKDAKASSPDAETLREIDA